MAGDRMGTGVIGSKRQCGIAELLKHHQKVTGRAVEVLDDVMGINAEIARGAGHELPKTDGADRAPRSRVVSTLNLDIGAVEERPIGDGEARAAQRVMACIAQGRGLDGVEDLGGGADSSRGRERCLDLSLRAFRLGEEKQAVCLRLTAARERAQGARVCGDGDQSAIGANREDETAGSRNYFCGQGR